MTTTAPPLVILLIGFFIACLTGCQEKPHPPRVGEYGEVLIKNYKLHPKHVDELNTLIPLTYSEAQKLPKYPKASLSFKGEMGKNPYRFVMVLYGKTLNAGDVKVTFTTDTGLSKGTGQAVLGLAMDEDESQYHANDEVVVVLSGEPFSLSIENASKEYTINAYLKQRENIKLQSVELQVWQGKGSKRSTASYATFGAILLFFLYLATRLARMRLSRE